MASSSLRGVSLSLSFRTASKSAHSFQELCPCTFIRFRARGRPAWGGARPRFLSSGLRDFLEVEEGPQTEAVDTAKRFGMYPISNRSRLVKIAVVGTDGVLARKEVTMADLRAKTGLHLAELLMVETASISISPRIMARTNCIIFNMAHVRALIFADEVVLFALRPASTQLAVAARFEESLVELLKERAKARAKGEEVDDVFELVVLEKCLQSVVNRFTVRIAHCTPMVDRMLRDMGDIGTSSEPLFRMFPLQNALTHYELSLGTVIDMIRAIDENAAVMEQMLENFHQMFVDLHRRVFQLQASMKSKREIMNIEMGSQRNNLMIMNIRLTVMSVGMATASLGATMFGMNLTSGLEQIPHGLAIASALFGGLGILVFRHFSVMLKHGRDPSVRATPHKLQDYLLPGTSRLPATIQNWLGMGDNGTHSRDHHGGKEGFITKDDFVMLLKAVDRSVTQEEIDLLYEMNDFNHDGVLTYDEMMGAVRQLHTRRARQ